MVGQIAKADAKHGFRSNHQGKLLLLLGAGIRSGWKSVVAEQACGADDRASP